jgi:hypothetical protein
MRKADRVIKRDASGTNRTFIFDTTFERCYPDVTSHKRLAKASAIPPYPEKGAALGYLHL